MNTVQIEDLIDANFDPRLADDRLFGDTDDPYRILSALRARGPVVEASLTAAIGMPFKELDGFGREFVVLSHQDVDFVLNNPTLFSSVPMQQALSNFGPVLTSLDPPDHTRYRRALQHMMGPHVVQSWAEHFVAPSLDEVISSFERDGRAELLEQFARPFPFEVIYRLLSLPAEDIATFYRLTIAQLGSRFADEASANLRRYFIRMIASRREDPETDLVSLIARVDLGGEPLPEDVALAFLLQLMSAGGETTFRTLSVLLFGLLTNPEQLQAVREDRSLVPQAIEEALRWDGPVMTGTRATTQETALAGVLIPAGSIVNAVYGAANRDPAVFEKPDDFDIFRDRHRHFGFAFGAHNCIGQVLARMELSYALNGFLDRLPDVRLDPGHPTPRLRGAYMRTPRELHVVFDSSWV